MSAWKDAALALAKAFERMTQLEAEARTNTWVEKQALKAELNESRAETEDARARCKGLEERLLKAEAELGEIRGEVR